MYATLFMKYTAMQYVFIVSSQFFLPLLPCSKWAGVTHKIPLMPCALPSKIGLFSFLLVSDILHFKLKTSSLLYLIHCNNHATSCVYNATLGHGECKNCIDNTHGVKCELCEEMFYRNTEQPVSHPETCLGKLLPG